MSTHHEITTVLDRWTAAEVGGDAVALRTLMTEDFIAIGPLGFLLSRQDWLDRHESGALSYDAFALEDAQLRVYDGAAVVVARQAAQGAYQGNAVPEALRITVVLARAEDAWRLAVVHMSFIAGTLGAPAIPGRG